MERLSGLQLFVRVVETGSFSKAAADLGLTQPTVTKQISAIERHLGVSLLNRNSRGVSLTEIGALYFERSKVVLHDLEECDNVVTHRLGNIKGTLRIGVSMAFGRLVVWPLLVGFLEAHPDIKVDLDCDDHYVDIVRRGLDVAIRLGKLADSSLGCRCVGANPWLVVASKRYLDKHGTPTQPRDLAAHQCLVYSTAQGDDVWRLQGADGSLNAIGVRGRLKSNNLSALLGAALAGLGVAILPCYLAVPAIRSGELCSVLDDCRLPEQEINAVFPSPRFVPASVRALTNYLQNHFHGQWWEPKTNGSKRPSANDEETFFDGMNAMPVADLPNRPAAR